MKKLLKMSLLGLVMGIALTSCNGCGGKADNAKNPIDSNKIDSGKIDSTAADGTRVKDDTSKKAKEDTTVKKKSTTIH